MPWGLVVLAACSWLVYSRARSADRSPLGWVLILWASLFAGSAVGMIAGAMLHGAGLGEIVIPIGMLCGILLAVVAVVRAAGQPARAAEVGAADPTDRPGVAPPPAETGATDGLCPHCRARLPAVWDAFCPECHEPLR